MLIFAQHTSYYQCLQQHCCKGRQGEHYVINHGCLYEPIIKRMVTAVKHSTNHKKSTDIISMIVVLSAIEIFTYSRVNPKLGDLLVHRSLSLMTYKLSSIFRNTFP